MSATEGPTVNPTDLLIAEFAATAGVDTDTAADMLARLTEAQLDRLAEITADLMVRNIVAGIADPINAAHRRVGREVGLAVNAANERKAVSA